MKHVLLVCLATAALAGCCKLTRDQADAAKSGGGTVGMLFGIPRPIGEALVGSALTAFGLIAGKKHERRCQRKAMKSPVLSK